MFFCTIITCVHCIFPLTSICNNVRCITIIDSMTHKRDTARWKSFGFVLYRRFSRPFGSYSDGTDCGNFFLRLYGCRRAWNCFVFANFRGRCLIWSVTDAIWQSQSFYWRVRFSNKKLNCSDLRCVFGVKTHCNAAQTQTYSLKIWWNFISNISAAFQKTLEPNTAEQLNLCRV